MRTVVEEIREACAWVAERARHVRIDEQAIREYAAGLPLQPGLDGADPEAHPRGGTRERRAAFWLTLDAINFGSGWFPTLKKRPGHSGYLTVAAGLKDHGPWSAEDLQRVDATEIAAALGQDPQHELMALFAASLNDLGIHVEALGGFGAVLDGAGGSAVTLAEQLSRWPCFADASTYDGRTVPFLKRAQIAAADLHRAGVGDFGDLERLTMFADNLVPHVLRIDGILAFAPELAARIERAELIEHGSPEEVEIRACALHAVELIAAARPDSCAAEIDQLLWLRGGEAAYKERPRHRSRCTAY